MGEIVVVYLGSAGPVSGAQPVLSGQATPSGLFPVSSPPIATVGGLPAPISYLGLTPGSVSLYQANLQIPAVSAGNQPLIISIGGAASSVSIIAVQ